MQRKKTILFVIIGCLIAVAAFFVLRSRPEPTATPGPTQIVSVTPRPDPEPEPVLSNGYHTLTLVTTKPGAELETAVGKENIAFVLGLNRIDAKFLKQNIVLTVPDAFENVAFPGFPAELPVAQEVPKLMLVSQRVQSFGAYEYGVLVRTGPVSTGKQSTPTESRLYSTNWKGKRVISTFSDEWILEWSWNLDNWGGASMHQYELPGYPASHSCVRLRREDAMWFYDWAQEWIVTPDGGSRLAHGTPVIVFGSYGFGKTAPWKKLSEDPTATTLTIEELNETVEKNLETIRQRQTEREAVLSAKNN